MPWIYLLSILALISIIISNNNLNNNKQSNSIHTHHNQKQCNQSNHNISHLALLHKNKSEQISVSITVLNPRMISQANWLMLTMTV